MRTWVSVLIGEGGGGGACEKWALFFPPLLLFCHALCCLPLVWLLLEQDACLGFLPVRHE